MAARIKQATGVDAQLVKGARGAFEVFKDDALVYSKLATGSFPATDDDVVKLLAP